MSRPYQGSVSLCHFVQGKTEWVEEQDSKTTQGTGLSLATCSNPTAAGHSLIENVFAFKDRGEALDVGVACALKVRGTAEQVPGPILHILQGGSK